jgi:uncharacterized membrane protein
VDCYFHSAVPATGRCTTCGKPLCATCRGAGSECASCRLASRVDAATDQRLLRGAVGPSHPGPATVGGAALSELRTESRALAALGYPFWPIALLALFDPSGSRFVKRNAWQALGFNFGMYGLAWMLSAIAAIPLIGISAWPLLPFILPITVVASVVFAVKAWRGEEVRVPFVSDVVDTRI